MPWIEGSSQINIFVCSVPAHLYTIIGMVSTVLDTLALFLSARQ
jgi:hypothetical protein